MKPISLFAWAATLLLAPCPSAIAETVNCTNITALPHTITVPGVYCLKQDLATSITSGNAITINANSVTIDFNGYKLGGLGAGPATTADGVFAQDRKNITLRNGNIRGFEMGIWLREATLGASSGHVLESNLLEANTKVGLQVEGSGIVVRANRVVNTDTTPPPGPSLQPSMSGSGSPAGKGIALSSDQASANSPVSQAGTGGVANGIAGILSNSQIIDNFVVGTVSSANQAFGIILAGASSNVEIARNTVLDTRGNSFTAGIGMQSSATPAMTFSENVVVGVTSSTAIGNGIWNLGGDLLCRDNTVANVTTSPTVGCDSESGTFPPVAP